MKYPFLGLQQYKGPDMEDKIYIKDLLKKIFKYKLAISLILIGATGFLISMSYLIPKTYRSEFEINVYSKYFKNGIISEVVPGVGSLKEMTDTINSMVREVMSDEYIDELGIEYKFYSDLRSSEELTTYGERYQRARERMFLRERFKYYSTGVQSYKVLFSGKDPLITLEVTKKVLERIKTTFVSKRLETIELARQSLFQKLESINLTRKITDDEVASNALASKNPQVLKSELLNIEQSISSLLKQFNRNHPRIRNLENRKQTISKWLSEFNVLDSQERDIEYSEAPLIMSGDSKVAAEIAAKLYVKYNNINIALEIERKNLNSYIGVIQRPQLPTSPIFPKKRIFASLGFVLGLVLCFIYIFYREIMVLRQDDYLELIAQKLETTYFGDFSQISKTKNTFIKDKNDLSPSPDLMDRNDNLS